MQKDVALKVSGEMAAILQSSRLCPDFEIQISDKPEPGSESQPQVSAPLVVHLLHCGYNGLNMNSTTSDCTFRQKVNRITYILLVRIKLKTAFSPY